uniref:Uncharacterized protein n=1 Tax=Picea glauca TaxID=3330 RepID=A0A101M379_PICGL|nr:hypothetical protein ABT39_MTgene3356 [Picea glauca]QHR89120.1 hypothetical protein Q903MT_gene3139 [Picea sitchensis]
MIHQLGVFLMAHQITHYFHPWIHNLSNQCHLLLGVSILRACGLRTYFTPACYVPHNETGYVFIYGKLE